MLAYISPKYASYLFNFAFEALLLDKTFLASDVQMFEYVAPLKQTRYFLYSFFCSFSSMVPIGLKLEVPYRLVAITGAFNISLILDQLI